MGSPTPQVFWNVESIRSMIKRLPGGSSGIAAAVASGQCFVATGSDTGGSMAILHHLWFVD